MRRAAAILVMGLAASGCEANAFDCAMGAMRVDCPSGTSGFDRSVARQQSVQRRCLARGLNPGTLDYAACLSALDQEQHLKAPLPPT